MNCYEFENNLSDFIEGELKQKDIIKIKSHKKECVNCSEKMESIISLISNLGNMNSIKVSDNFSDKLHNEISILDSRMQTKSWNWLDIFDFGFKPKQALAFGSSILLIASSIFYYSKIEIVPNINMANFKKMEPIKPGLIPDLPQSQSQVNYATTPDSTVQSRNGKNKRNIPPIQVVNSKK